MTYTVAFVGTGDSPDDPDTDGYAMAYRHASGYERLDDCVITACADIVPENAEAFADHWGFAADDTYEDAETMMREVEPDIVSVCVPPQAHAPVVTSCVAAHPPAAIHCEKPMADSWGACREMVETCREAGVQLTFNHQRRFARPVREAKRLLDDDRIGALDRIEVGGPNLYDYGSHLFDLCGYVTDQASPSWVLAGLDYTEPNVQFGAHNENQAVVQWAYDDGVTGIALTGRDSPLSAQLRLLGADGVLEIGANDAPLRLRENGAWTAIDTGDDGIHGVDRSLVTAAATTVATRVPGVSDDRFDPPTFIDRAIADVVRAIDGDRQSELRAENALTGTEVIFAAWESVRRRGRVDLPLAITDNPLASMVENGTLLSEPSIPSN